MSTDPADFTGNSRREVARYAISPPVRVRKEAFGLLFFNTEDSRLTFIKSGDLLQVAALPHGGKIIAVSPESSAQAKVKRLIDQLLQKGLLCEA